MQKSSTPDSITPATPDKPRNSLFTWRNLGRCLIALAVLATLIGLFYAEEDWRGHHAWEKYKQEAEARGVILDWQKFIPSPVPDDQNFAMTPFLAPLFDLNPDNSTGSNWRDTNGYNRAQMFALPLMKAYDSAHPNASQPFMAETVPLEAIVAAIQKQEKLQVTGTNLSREAAGAFILERMKPYQSVLDELRAASQRPYSRFNIRYNQEDPASILLPHLAILKKLTLLLQLNASSELAVGKTDAAFDDVRLIHYLADSIQNEPFIISQLVRIAMFKISKQVIWEGLAEHRWSDAQLQAFQNRLEKVSLIKAGQFALEGERAAFGVTFYDFIRKQPEILPSLVSGFPDATVNDDVVLLRFAPNGWLYQEQLLHQQVYDKLMLAFDAENGVVHPRGAESAAAESDRDRGGALHRLLHHEVLLAYWLPSFGQYCQKPPAGQASIDQIIIACALERYHMANGKYPETLAALVPQFLTKLPLDVCNGQPMKYRRTDDGQFLLYSVGWNEKDDGGTVVMQKDQKRTQDLNEGDWVWPAYPK